jgi:phytoene dehydrogenase-like protein
MEMTPKLTIVGGGLGGLVTAIAAREAGVDVRLLEAKRELGGRARSSAAPYIANWGPHALYADGAMWRWLDERGLTEPCARPPLRHPLLFRWDAELRRLPERVLLTAVARLHRAGAPVDRSFLEWAAEFVGEEVATRLARMAGVFSFDHDPGRLSAAFIRDRLVRVTTIPSPARFVVGGWSALVARLAHRARALGARIETGARIDIVPDPPVALAVPIANAAELLDDQSLTWTGTTTALLDLAIKGRRGDPYVVWDLDEGGWIETFTYADPSLAPRGEHLVQAQAGLRPGESVDDGVRRLEAMLDAAYPAWRERETWRRRGRVRNESGALDLPGTTWRDRPSVARGDGVYVVGDMMAAPGLLSEVAHASALEAIDSVTCVGLPAKHRSAAV